MLEMGVFGRTAMGETLTSGYFNDQWRIHRDGRLIHAEAVLLDGDIGQKLATPAAGGGHISMGTLIYLAGDAEAYQTMTREHFAAYADLQIAVSAWQQSLSFGPLPRITPSLRQLSTRFLQHSGRRLFPASGIYRR